MRIPLDFYRILGIPQQTTEEAIEQAYQDRLVQLPRREFSDAAITVRNGLLAIAYEALTNPESRQAYDQDWYPTASADPNPFPLHQPEWDCEESQLIGALLIWLELGEYELVLGYGEPVLSDPDFNEDPLRPDYLLCVTFAHWELSHEHWQQQQYELAATAGLKALARLQQENTFPALQEAIRQELYKLRPYRILELLTVSPPDSDPNATQPRQQGVELLQHMIRDRGGIEGKGDDHSGLGNDDFLTFTHHLRPYLTLAEQNALFLPETQRPSRVAIYLAIHTLIAQGIREKRPQSILDAKAFIAQLNNCQELALERAVCELLLGQIQALSVALNAIQDPALIAALEKSATEDPSDPLITFYLFTETWLTKEILPHFRDLDPTSLSLTAYFDDPAVQHILDNLVPDRPSPTPSPTPHTPSESPQTPLSPEHELETPMVNSASAYTPEPLPQRRPRNKRRAFTNLPNPEGESKRGSSQPLTPLTYGHLASQAGQAHQAQQVTVTSPVSAEYAPPAEAIYTPLEPGSQGSRAKRRRRKKRVSINPWRFGVFVLGMAGLVGGAAVLLLWRSPSPSVSLDNPALDIALDQTSPLIPDAAAEKALLLTQPDLTEAVAQQVVQTWLDQKKVAFGETHDVNALKDILSPRLFQQQQSRVKKDQTQQRYRQYEHQFKILKFQTDPRNPTQAIVVAQVQEKSQPFSLTSKQPDGATTKDDLTVRYHLIRVQDHWKIDTIQVSTGN